MKKVVIIMSCAVVVLLGIILFISSRDKGQYAGSPYLGTWKAVSAEYSDVEISIEDLYGSDGFTITFNSDGTCEAVYQGKTKDGSWEDGDDGARASVAENMIFTIEDNKLKAEVKDMTVLFDKQ